MIALLVAASFAADFPQAQLVKSDAAIRSASGFSAPGDARAFLEKYAESFGITSRQKLTQTLATPTLARFGRSLDGAPIFDGDIAVGLDGSGAVTLVNSGEVPAPSGEPKLSRKAAQKIAGGGRGERGWKAFAGTLRPVWRIDSGERRTFVDADSGKVLLRVPLRTTNRRG
jgi:hypothetical protein